MEQQIIKKSGKIIIHFLSSNTIHTCFLNSHTLNFSLPSGKNILYSHFLLLSAPKSPKKSTSPLNKIKSKPSPLPTYLLLSTIMLSFSIKLALIISHQSLLLPSMERNLSKTQILFNKSSPIIKISTLYFSTTWKGSVCNNKMVQK